MRSKNLFYCLLCLFGCVVLLWMPVCADPEVHQPTLIIPTKFRFLLLDMAQAVVPAPPPAEPVQPALQPEVQAPLPAAEAESRMSEEEYLASLKPGLSSAGMGRGFVQTNFDVSFQVPGGKIDNRERLTARGLFDVHVAHGFS